jgi:anti-sigma factor RsiW
MNCQDCRARISAYLDGDLNPDLAEEVRGHAALCRSCRLELALARRIDRGLANLAAPVPPRDFTARVMAALPAGRPAPVPFWPQLLSMAACAASSLAVLYGLWQHVDELNQVGRAVQGWAAGIAGRGLAAAPAEPGQAYGLLVWLRGWAADATVSLAGYLELVPWLYSRNLLSANLAAAAAAALWLLLDHSRRARA